MFSITYKITIDIIKSCLYSGGMNPELDILYSKEYQELAKQKQDKLKIVKKAERFADKVEQMLSQKAPPKRST